MCFQFLFVHRSIDELCLSYCTRVLFYVFLYALSLCFFVFIDLLSYTTPATATTTSTHVLVCDGGVSHALTSRLSLSAVAVGTRQVRAPAALTPHQPHITWDIDHHQRPTNTSVTTSTSLRGGSRILEWGHRSSAEGASIEAPQAPIEWGLGMGCPFPNKGVWSGSGQ